ncbi:carboxymuconolactone decarboxylase family protein [Allosphingosinicella deserti]|uniref:carboxymuconolactone decarboxylase family protein n=1 Tax=Allosphingosinicella deserti TaxID=2116704 RepID=UPI001304887A|nr:carboxymuconolactone decarboxylase family protein [Sphingomonas deserti]
MSRIKPLEAPFPDWFAEAMAKVMPPGVPPLALFRSIATSERAWTKFSAGSLLDKGPLSLRQREVVIDRTTARCGCDYEWGIHAALFARRADLSEAQLADSAAESIDPGLWADDEIVLLATTDALLDRKRLEDAEFDRLRAHFSDSQILEIVQLVAFYHGVSLICGTLALAPEPGTPTLPFKGV